MRPIENLVIHSSISIFDIRDRTVLARITTSRTFLESRPRKCVIQCDIVARSVREFNDICAGTFDVWMHCIRARRREGRMIEEEIVGNASYCLSMYNSELFKTVWTKIGQMCGYITCAKSYLSGQYIVKNDSNLVIIVLSRSQLIIVRLKILISSTLLNQ